MKAEKQRDIAKTKRSMKFFNFIYIVLALLSIGKIFHIQYFWNPYEQTKHYFTPKPIERKIDPKRGNILSDDGRPLAMAAPNYHVTMDCAIHKKEYDRNATTSKFPYTFHLGKKDSTVRLNGKEMEREWRKKAKLMSEGLSKILGKKSGEVIYKEIIEKREAGKHYYKIADFIDFETKTAIEQLPLIKEGRYKSGVIIEKEDVREYPYGSLARRTIGYIPKKGNVSGNKTGLEYTCDSLLHGKEGREFLIDADGKEKIVNHRKGVKKVQDGYDIRTTLNVDIQNICDRELRKTFESRDDIEGGCLMVMDVETGAIKAMVNLKKGENGAYVENYNYAVLYKGATGSVFKAASLMALLEDNKVQLNDTVSTYGGVYRFNGWTCDDRMHTGPKLYPSGKISIKEGLAISSNIVFSTLVHQHYKDNPAAFREMLHRFHLDENYDFDIEGLQTPVIPKPGQANWSGSTLPNISIGSSIDLCPLHTLCFYNAVAGRGRLMKPYLVQAVEKDGELIQKIEPTVINEQICRQEVADSLISGLCEVTANKKGTAYWAFRNCPYRFAGKTGTGRLTFVDDRNRTVTMAEGQTKNIGTFIGFFPAEKPKYTIMAVGYQRISVRSLYGSVFAYTVRNVADALYAMDCENGQNIQDKGALRDTWKKDSPSVSASESNIVPDLKNCGLADAIWKIENSGYQCEYQGVGSVVRQSPAAGSKYTRGGTIRIVLK